MTFSEIKTLAREHLKGKWGIAILAMILFSAISGLPSTLVQSGRFGVDNLKFLLPLSQVVSIISILLIPLVVGYNRIHLDIAEEKQPNLDQMFYPFRRGRYGRSLLTMFLYQLFLIGWTLLFIIPGIIKSFSYALTSYILADPDYDAYEGTDPITESREMMDGHKMEFFLLILSIIWWIIPAVIILPFLVITASLWVLFGVVLGVIVVAVLFLLGPYIQQVTAEFYLELKGRGKALHSTDTTTPRHDEYYIPLEKDPLEETKPDEKDDDSDPFDTYYK